MRLYQVKSGENLPDIASAVLGDRHRWLEIVHLNAIPHPYFVRPGQVIELPDDSSPPAVIVDKGIHPGAPVVKQANFELSPAIWGLLITGALVLWWKMK